MKFGKEVGNTKMRRFSRLIGCLLVVCSAGCGSGSSSPAKIVVGNTRIAVNDPNLFLSPYNWSVEGTTRATTTQPGAYLTFGFQSATVHLNIDTTALASLPSGTTPVVRWQIDGGSPQNYQIAPGDEQILLNSVPLAAGKHFCKIWFVAADYRQDRWTVPAEALRITGLTLDGGGTTVAPTLLTKRILFFGDSITEGVRTESALNIPMRDDDATHAFPYTCAAALNAEFGVVGVARQGWTIAGYDGSNVPAFASSWPLEFAGKPRIFSPAPDYVINAEGTNDSNNHADPLQVMATVQTWLVAARSAMPTSRICIMVPFSGFERDAITQAVQNYRASHPSDKNVFLIDLGTQPLLADLSGTSSSQAYDGFHPNAATSEALGVKLAAAIQAIGP